MQDFVPTSKIAAQTPTFDVVFKPVKLRLKYTEAGKRSRRLQHLPPNAITIIRKLLRRRGRQCCSNKCMKLLDDYSFIQEAAKWRCSWIMTPRRQKQDAILLFLKGRKPANSFQEIGTCLKDGRRHLDLQQQPRAEAEEQQPRVEAEAELSAQPKQSQKSQKSQQYSFLGRNKLCSRAWRHYTGVSAGSLHRAVDMVQRGVQNFARKAPARLARRRDEMVHAVWMVVQDLHHQSPYTNRSQPNSWHIPFHHKICLWRLVKKDARVPEG